MNKKKLGISLTLLLFAAIANAQINSDSGDFNGYNYTFENETYKTNASFLGFHGYYITSAEIIPVRTDLFENLFDNDDIPTVKLNPTFTLAWMSFMRNWMFTSLSYSYTLTNKEVKDSLISRLDQYSFAARFGYNIVRKPAIVVSPYVGLRYTGFKHLTSLSDKKVSLDNYMMVRDIDLSVMQFSGEIGINSTFLVYNRWSVGFYASYLIDFSDNPIIKTRNNRIQEKINNPVKNFVMGLGFGMGFNDR